MKLYKVMYIDKKFGFMITKVLGDNKKQVKRYVMKSQNYQVNSAKRIVIKQIKVKLPMELM